MMVGNPITPNRGAPSIRTLLVVMIGALAGLAMALSGIIVLRLVASVQANAEKELDRASRDIGFTVDREIASVTNLLTALITSDSLRRGDFERLYRKSAEISGQVGFHIALRQLQRNEWVFNTAFPWGATLDNGNKIPMGEVAHNALRSGTPVLSAAFFGPRLNRNIVVECVPLRETSGVQYALCGIVDLDVFAEILKQSRLEDNWIVTIIDHKGGIVARSKDHDKFAGVKAASLDLLEPGMPSGLARGPNAEGVPFVWAYRRMEATGWVVGVGVPQSVFDEPMLFGLGGMLIIGFVLAFLAAVMAHRTTGPLSRSIKELRDAVSAVRREPKLARSVAARSASYWEISSVLAAASEELLAVKDRRQFVLAAANVGTWQWDLVTGKEAWSDRYREILGVSGEVEPGLENFLAQVHSSDRPSVADAVTRNISGSEEYDREYRIVRADTGEERWVHAKARVERDRLGRPLRVLGVAMDITVRRQNECERDDLRRRLMRAQEDERLRLAHELHDQTGQSLTAVMLELKDIESMSDGCERDRLCRLRLQMEQMGKALHHVAWELRPASLDELGLASALANYATEWSEQYRIETDFHCADPLLDELSDEIRTTIYRVAQEGLTNIAKHAPTATSVSVVIDRVGTTMVLTIEDNGRGFDATGEKGPAGERSGLGLAGVRERLSLVGGEFEIESSVGAGTTVFVRIPLPLATTAA